MVVPRWLPDGMGKFGLTLGGTRRAHGHGHTKWPAACVDHHREGLGPSDGNDGYQEKPVCGRSGDGLAWRKARVVYGTGRLESTITSFEPRRLSAFLAADPRASRTGSRSG